MAQLPPTALFSPSLARAHLATTKDWNYVDAWLLKHLSKPPPPFERNGETLKALLALAAHNESADEERDLFARIEQKALQELKSKGENDSDKEFLGTIEDSLTREGQGALNTLAESSVQVNQPLPDVENMGTKIVRLQAGMYDLEQAGHRISVLENHLKEELKNIEKLVRDLQGEAYQPPADLTKQTNDYQRRAKVLSSKLPELRARVTSLQSGIGEHVTIEDVKLLEDKYKDSTIAVKDLETQVKSFHGLPQDTDLARLELEGLRVELQALTVQRDWMFEGLVERESPKKTRS